MAFVSRKNMEIVVEEATESEKAAGFTIAMIVTNRAEGKTTGRIPIDADDAGLIAGLIAARGKPARPQPCGNDALGAAMAPLFDAEPFTLTN